MEFSVTDKIYSKVGINTKHNYLRDKDYIKPNTPEEYKKIKYKGQQRPKSIEDSSNFDTSQEQENSKSTVKQSEVEEQPSQKLPKSKSPEKQTIEKKKFDNLISQSPSEFQDKSTKKFKFSSTEREPTFLYTRSPFTFFNEKIKQFREIRKLEKESVDLTSQIGDKETARIHNHIEIVDKSVVHNSELNDSFKNEARKKLIMKIKTDALMDKNIHICDRYKEHVNKHSK